eukprot:1994296-Pleurochrysis_carterae.AAC.2
MPATELFGAWAVAQAAAAAKRRRPSVVIAVGDSDPAPVALNAAANRKRQMQALVRWARELTPY